MATGLRFDLIICDVDNTLYNWLDFYIPSFQAMLAEIQRISGLNIEVLRESFVRLNRQYKTTEYPFSIEFLDALQVAEPKLTPVQRLAKYDSAIHAFRSTRRKTLEVYPGVKATLARLTRSGVVLVAHSDSMSITVGRRLRQLGIDTYFDSIFASRDSGVPAALRFADVRTAHGGDVDARVRLEEFAEGVRKPDIETIMPVLEKYKFRRDRVLYVGDSLSRDVVLARRAGVVDAWASYGHHSDKPDLYAELKKITFWGPDDVTLEEQLQQEAMQMEPSFTLKSFTELAAICGLSPNQ